MQKQHQEPQVQWAIKLPKSFMDRLDKLAETMSEPGMKLKRSAVLRLAAHRGLEQLESEQKKAKR